MVDIPGAQLLGLRRKAEERIDLAVDEQLLRLDRWARDPIDVGDGVEPDISGHDREKAVPLGPDALYPHTLTSQVA